MNLQFENVKPVAILNMAAGARVSPKLISRRTGTSSTVFGGMKLIGSNQPRMNDAGGLVGLNVSGSRYNYAAGANFGNGGALTQSNLVKTASNAGAFGDPFSWILTKSTNGPYRYMDWNNGLASVNPHLFSVFVKNVGSIPTSVYLHTIELNGQQVMIAVDFTEKKNATSLYPGMSAGYEVLDDGWYRLWASVDSKQIGAYIGRVGFYDPANSSVATAYDAAQVKMSGFSLEYGRFPKPHVYDSQVGVTTPGDEYELQLTESCTEYTIAAVVEAKDLASLFLGCIPDEGNVLSGISFLNGYDATMMCEMSGYHSGNSTTLALKAPQRNSRVAVVYSYNPSGTLTGLNSNVGDANSILSAQASVAFTKLRMGILGTHNSCNSKIRKLFVWPKAFSGDVRKKILTALGN